MQILEQE